MSSSYSPRLDQRLGPSMKRARRSEAFEKLARAGYAAKGVLYFTMGALAARGAFGAGRAGEGSHGALREVGRHGEIVLGILAVGLVAYALHRLVDAVANPEGGIAARAGRVLSAFVHGGLAVSALQIANGSRGGSDDHRHWTAELMSAPFGRALVLAVGVVVIGFGVQQMVKAWKADLWTHLDVNGMRPALRRAVFFAGRAGYAARGVVFGCVGGFVVRAALTFDPSESRGIPGALRALRRAPFGAWVLGIVAVGLIAYALFCLVRARHFRVAVR